MDRKKRLVSNRKKTIQKKIARKKTAIFLITSLLCLALLGCNQSSQMEAKKDSEKDPILMATGHESIEPPPPDIQKAALVNVELGLGYLSQGNTARAKSKFTHALKLAPQSHEVHTAMAFFLEKIGDAKESEKEHRKAIRYGSGKGSVYNNYGAFLCRQGRLKEADATFQKALLDKEYERTAEIYENAGMCSVKAEDLAAAENYFKTALMRDPKRSNTMLELVSLNLKQGNLPQAKTYLTHYKQTSEPSARSLWLGIQLAHRMQDTNGVLNQSLVLKNLFESSPEYQQYLQSGIGVQE